MEISKSCDSRKLSVSKSKPNLTPPTHTTPLAQYFTLEQRSQPHHFSTRQIINNKSPARAFGVGFPKPWGGLMIEKIKCTNVELSFLHHFGREYNDIDNNSIFTNFSLEINKEKYVSIYNVHIWNVITFFHLIYKRIQREKVCQLNNCSHRPLLRDSGPSPPSCINPLYTPLEANLWLF